ncbi:putative glyoxalase superfamily protein PhnB [Geomicrobium sediminis]|uniref:Glyoxalase superfamily protein PhnB n=1 Tax=Geomicrobium sediminis TaxID=1347788 RepID=A0ABS2PIW4_9BACL|nr:putative glyoxalase superfamily protein PhnB [Geomicrobium sediminis]
MNDLKVIVDMKVSQLDYQVLIHLEFTHHHDGSPCPAPTRDNLLVFYIEDYEQIRNVAYRLCDMGYPEVAPENEYWKEKGVTIEDPDGWRVVMMNQTYG